MYLSLSLVCNSMSPNAVFWWALYVAHSARSINIVLGIPSTLIVGVCGYTDTTRNSPTVSANSLLYVLFFIAFAKRVAAAESGDWSTRAM